MHIAIAGGGIAGLAGTIALARRGHRITVMERADEFSETGAGIQIGPNGVRALEALGLAGRLEAVAVRPERLVVRSGTSGRLIAKSALGARIEARFGAPWLTVLRTDLLSALLAGARSLAAVTLRLGTTVASYAGTKVGIECRLADGGSVTADALIGADGIRSAVRQHMLGDGEPADNRLVIYRALVPATSVPQWAREAAVNLWLLPGRHVVHYPVAAGSLINIVNMTQGVWSGTGWSALAEPGEALGGYGSADAALSDVLKAPAAWLKWAGCDRPPAPRWSDGRACLIGDAAHPVLPCLAQGAVMALEDAVVLAGLLPEAGDPLAAFAAFEAARKARTSRVQAESRRQASIYHLSSPARLARNLVMKSLLGGDQLTERTAWLYSWQPDTAPAEPEIAPVNGI